MFISTSFYIFISLNYIFYAAPLWTMCWSIDFCSYNGFAEYQKVSVFCQGVIPLPGYAIYVFIFIWSLITSKFYLSYALIFSTWVQLVLLPFQREAVASHYGSAHFIRSVADLSIVLFLYNVWMLTENLIYWIIW